MDTRTFKVMLAAASLISLVGTPSIAASNGTDRGGGDVFATEFKEAGRDLLLRLRDADLSRVRGLDLLKLSEAIETTEVRTVDQACLTQPGPGGRCPSDQQRDAINIPSQKLIELTGKRWVAIRDSERARQDLVLHEYFSILRIEKNTQAVSSQVLAILRDEVVPVEAQVFRDSFLGRRDSCLNRCDWVHVEEKNQCSVLRYESERGACKADPAIGGRMAACYRACDRDPSHVPTVVPGPIEARGRPLSAYCEPVENAELPEFRPETRYGTGTLEFAQAVDYLKRAHCLLEELDGSHTWFREVRDDAEGRFSASGASGNLLLISQMGEIREGQKVVHGSGEKDTMTVTEEAFIRIPSRNEIRFYLKYVNRRAWIGKPTGYARYQRWVFYLDSQGRLERASSGIHSISPGIVRPFRTNSYSQSWWLPAEFGAPGANIDLGGLAREWKTRGKKELKEDLKRVFER